MTQHAETRLYSFQDGRCRVFLIPCCPCHPLVQQTGPRAALALEGYCEVVEEMHRQAQRAVKARVMQKIKKK